jgi:hypothetical protein
VPQRRQQDTHLKQNDAEVHRRELHVAVLLCESVRAINRLGRKPSEHVSRTIATIGRDYSGRIPLKQATGRALTSIVFVVSVSAFICCIIAIGNITTTKNAIAMRRNTIMALLQHDDVDEQSARALLTARLSTNVICLMANILSHYTDGTPPLPWDLLWPLLVVT